MPVHVLSTIREPTPRRRLGAEVSAVRTFKRHGPATFARFRIKQPLQRQLFRSFADNVCLAL
jgi:hypothetical protein